MVSLELKVERVGHFLHFPIDAVLEPLLDRLFASQTTYKQVVLLLRKFYLDFHTDN